MSLLDFFKQIFGGKQKVSLFMPAEPGKPTRGCHLTVVAMDRDVIFFDLHEGYDEAERQFKMLVDGHWCGFTRNNTHAVVLPYDYYAGELLMKKEVIYRDLSKKKLM